MYVRVKRDWELPESAATPEATYRSRRSILRAAAAGSLLVGAGGLLSACDEGDMAPSAQAATERPWAELYPVERNARYKFERDLTPEKLATTYNNFYEFGSSKNIWDKAQALTVRPWTIKIGGLVEKSFELDMDDLLKQVSLEERVYRLRCVEAWSMTVPWSGFPMKSLVDIAKPLGSAKYVRMETFHDPEMASGQRAPWYPWPYVEGLTMAEAANDLAFIATGLYGKPIPKQNGAPLRLAVPWKYGFKSVKSIVRMDFVEERPVTFWEEIQPREYGFWANVNPEVPHPRWSQATERVIGTDERVPTQLFNGYGEHVAGLYKDLPEDERLFM